MVTGGSPVLSDEQDVNGLPDGELVTFMGQQYPYKGVDNAVDAFERVAGGHPDATLVIAGPPTTRTERLVSRSAVRDRTTVRLPGEYRRP